MSHADLMTLCTTRLGASTVVTVIGELDLQTARDLRISVDDASARPGLEAVVVDLTGVSFLGSSGLGTLAELAGRIPVRLVAAPGNRAVHRPWETMNLQRVLPLFPDVDAAVADLTRQ